MPKIMDLSVYIGMSYGQLTIESIERINSKLYVSAKCTCGKTGSYMLVKLKDGHTKSCGCLRKKIMSDILTTHGLYHTRINNIWNGMIDRCRRVKNKNYKNYGGRGITVCEEWATDFMAFYNWAMNNGYSDELTIERNDVNGNYEPGNCKWITHSKQALNRRDNHFVTYNGVTKTIAEWAKDLNMNYNTLINRLNTYRWGIEKALTEPVKL
jgi:hypothetical protein